MRVEEPRLALLSEPVALPSDVENVAVVEEPVQDGRSDDRVAQQFTSLAKAVVRGSGAPGLRPHTPLHPFGFSPNSSSHRYNMLGV